MAVVWGNLGGQTAVLVKAVLSRNDCQLISLDVLEWFSHCYHIRRTSLVCLLILCTPGSDDIAKMAALVLDLCIVAHDARPRLIGRDPRCG